MERRKKDQRWAGFAAANSALIDNVRQELRQRGPLRNRDFEGKKVTNYRAGKDTGVALYHLWLTGELMTHHRHGKERVYDFLENVAPAHLQHSMSGQESEEYFINKAFAHLGLIDARTFRKSWKSIRESPVDLKEAESKLAAMVESGQIAPIQLEGANESLYCLAADRNKLKSLQNGRIPSSWQPIETSTQEEITLLSLLEYVSARRRAMKLFNFDYIWEIYKPAVQRKYGPYTLPILFGDQLVARMDARLDRPTQTLVINGLWLESWFKPEKPFAIAFARGLVRFARFLDAKRLDVAAIKLAVLRKTIAKEFPI